MEYDLEPLTDETSIERALREQFTGLEPTGPPPRLLMPALYRLLTRLLHDRDLPRAQRPYVIGAIGALCLSQPLLEDAERNALGLAYLVGSVCRRVAQKQDNRVLQRNWPLRHSAPELLSSLIRTGNDTLRQAEIREVFRQLGFEVRE